MQNEENNISAIVGIAAGLLFVFGLGVGIHLYSVTSETSSQDADKTSLPAEP